MADSGNKWGFTQEQYDRYKNDGFSDKEIEQIQIDRDAMLKLYSNKTQREIVSSTYIRSQKALTKQVEDWFGIKKG